MPRDESRDVLIICDENGTVDEHRAQAREQYLEMVVWWIERVTK